MKYFKYVVLGTMLASASIIAVQASKSQTAQRKGMDMELLALQSATPFQNNNGIMPPPGVPTFKLNHAWPGNPLPPLVNPPWQRAIGGGLITTANARAYAEALKASIATNGRNLITRGNGFDAVAGRWYNEPWLGSQREAIQGTYAAGEFGPAIFPGTGLRATFDTHVLTYYDERAAASLYRVWGPTAMNPNLSNNNAQFAEGSIIVKAAVFASTDPNRPTGWWDAMAGAQAWNMLLQISQGSAPRVWPGYVAQFDIIVKDSRSAPKTGWVFTTLVYDGRIRSADPWDKMVVLGAQWGNDPQATAPGMPLVENWVNPAAPIYSKQTLGFGGRLSGPNDGARNDIAVNGRVVANAPDSSCMSCHSTAQWNVAEHRMPSFLLPSYPAPPTLPNPPFSTCDANGRPVTSGKPGPNICSPAPGSSAWMKWFQNRLGTSPMDGGSVATDFDEVFSFKSLPLWWVAVGPKDQAVPMLARMPVNGMRYNQYTGAPLPPRNQ